MKLLMIDKDGTLVKPVSGSRFVESPTDQESLPGAREAIARYAAEEWVIIIISNQGGVAAVHKPLENAIAEMRFCLGLFPEIVAATFCPCPVDSQGDHCWIVSRDEKDATHFTWDYDDPPSRAGFRKPHPGMLLHAMYEFQPNQTLYVGDRPEDEQAAIAAGVPFMDAEVWRSQAL